MSAVYLGADAELDIRLSPGSTRRAPAPQEFDLESFAWNEACNVCQVLGTTSNTKREAARQVFLNAGGDAPYLPTQSAAFEAAEREPYADYECEGS